MDLSHSEVYGVGDFILHRIETWTPISTATSVTAIIWQDRTPSFCAVLEAGNGSFAVRSIEKKEKNVILFLEEAKIWLSDKGHIENSPLF